MKGESFDDITVRNAIVRRRMGANWTDIAAAIGCSPSGLQKAAERYEAGPNRYPSRDWQDRARCRTFHDFPERPVAYQKAACLGMLRNAAGVWEQSAERGPCPVRLQCIEQAMRDGPPFAGVHGGLTVEELEQMHGARRKAS